ncbi:hypothetical protein N864_01355 [Intrasporangium chromatireducens Q5-1]|uniref:DUF58 domain-containing protein n=1 Tax=Intrasporangium chromatireducens Q5-1 TaxID=584657 RepID=W9GLF9_9MICO|nr:DUF58 domain-containing protein [Intrasporangium chromatireducens]EWT05947.1 hypothetical protein N864_01355 [Intrasporangium chromatireducens Q5-1]
MTAEGRPTRTGRRLTVTRQLGEWAPTAAHVRAVLLGGGALALGAILRRPDLIVIGVPLVVAAVWGQLTRPREDATARAQLAQSTLREGESSSLVVRVEPLPADCSGVMLLAETQWVQRNPPAGVAPVEGLVSAMGVRSMRWGVRPLGTVSIALTSPWGAFRCGPVDLPDLTTTTLPVPAVFDASAPTPHPRGIVGINRSARPGAGSEFNTIREFQPGDRLRRIHWPVSLRTGRLHVTSTFADEDAHVVLLVDAFSDLGPREGIDGRPTSLDVTVRAAGALADHFLRAGDRLTLRTVGAADIPPLGVGSGTHHLRRVLETLARIEPASERRDDGRRAIRGLDPLGLVLVLSPLIEPTMVELTTTLASRGLTTVVIDTFPEHLTATPDDPYQALAWRIRLLSRQAQVGAIISRGVPVVPWRGPGSLDNVLRDVAHRATAPRMVRR